MIINVGRRQFISALGIAAVGRPLAACAQQPAAEATPRNDAYKIGPLDVLEVTVFKVPDLSKTVRVDHDGSINYPLIGQIPAAGKTAHQLELDLTQRLDAKYLRSPQVTVIVKENNSR
jgi:polysaccharide export outer membrane protein